jgi:hypothetical protein
MSELETTLLLALEAATGALRRTLTAWDTLPLADDWRKRDRTACRRILVRSAAMVGRFHGVPPDYYVGPGVVLGTNDEGD